MTEREERAEERRDAAESEVDRLRDLIRLYKVTTGYLVVAVTIILVLLLRDLVQ